MLVRAGKYSTLPVAKPPAAAPLPSRSSTSAGPPARARSAFDQAILDAEAKRQARSPHIFIPQFRHLLGYREWVWKEFREGGFLAKLFQREKGTVTQRIRRVAKFRDGFKQNPKAEHRLLASVPAREFFRARQIDRHFWSDNQNLKNYKRDNPDVPVYL
jgi:hypothetical protein